MSIEIISQQMTGTWQSIAPELRPGTQKSPAGNLQPFYLSRTFQYVDGIFDLRIDNYADPNGKYLVMRIYLAGHVEWKGPHPIAPGAQKVDFTADLKYNIMPVAPVFTEGLNLIAAEGFDKWETGREQSILWKAFKPFGIVAGQLFKEYDLVYLEGNMLFWGARHVDGRGFDTEANRPTNLQIPMIRI